MWEAKNLNLAVQRLSEVFDVVKPGDFWKNLYPRVCTGMCTLHACLHYCVYLSELMVELIRHTEAIQKE